MDRREATFPDALVGVADRVEARHPRAARRRDHAVVRGRRVARRTARRAAGSRRRGRQAPAARRSATARSSAAAATRATTRVIDAAAALELVHTFALVHDDVMDGSDTPPRPRRGPPPLRHAATTTPRWRGEAASLRRGHGDPRRRLRVRLRRHARARRARRRCSTCSTSSASSCASGSRSTRRRPRPPSTDAAAARRIALYKSAKYTVERPLHLGAALAGRLPELAGTVHRDRAAARRGVPAARRRPRRVRRGRRHRQAGRRRPPRRQGDAARRDRRGAGRTAPTARCSAGSVRPTSTPDEVAALQDLFVRSGALKEVEREIERLVGETHRALDAAPITRRRPCAARRARRLRRLAGPLIARIVHRS